MLPRSPTKDTQEGKELLYGINAFIIIVIRYGVVANIIAFHAIARGSIPRIGITFLTDFIVFQQVHLKVETEAKSSIRDHGKKYVSITIDGSLYKVHVCC